MKAISSLTSSFLLLVALAACGTSEILGHRVEVVVYLLLSEGPDTMSASTRVDSTLHALVATSIGPPPTYRYLQPSSFTMRRRSDGSVFGWVANAKQGDFRLESLSTEISTIANYSLPWADRPTGLGRQSLTVGETYDLTIVLEDRMVTGTATLPAKPIYLVNDVNGRTRVTWSAPGASGFEILVESDIPSYLFMQDTSYYVKFDNPYSPQSPRFHIGALDANAWRYLTDTTISSAGLTGAVGLFGAIARNAIRFP